MTSISHMITLSIFFYSLHSFIFTVHVYFPILLAIVYGHLNILYNLFLSGFKAVVYHICLGIKNDRAKFIS